MELKNDGNKRSPRDTRSDARNNSTITKNANSRLSQRQYTIPIT